MTPSEKPAQKNTQRGWFDRVFERRNTVGGRYLQLHLAPSGDKAASLGISVSKRICPSAVSRNYCKRMLRDWYRQHSAAFGNNDLVVRVKRRYDRRDYLMVSEELAKLLKRVA